jgi:3-oxoacyl-[acyl-carrier-protein] synthase II
VRIALERAGWNYDQVDLYNAHGTSTPINDKTESGAVRAVFGAYADELPVHSTKSMIGHCLGAAGAVETIAVLLGIERGIIHPTINYENPDPECNINIIYGGALERKVDRAIINNAGFGGHNGVLAVERFSG